jgi:cAMP-dependent protein kinase regulator
MILRRYRIEDLDKYLARRDYAAALAAIAEELKRHPENFNLLLRQAEILAAAGDREHALEVYRNLANHFAKQGRYTMAIAVTNKILRLDPTQTQAAADLQQLLETQRRLEEESRGKLLQLAQKPSAAPQTTPAPPPAPPPASPPAAAVPPQPPPQQLAPQEEQEAVRFFSAFPAEALAELLGSTSVRSYRPGSIIVREGEPGDSLFLIVDGSVEVSGTDPQGRPVALATLSRGDFFGEVAVLTGKPRTATVVAATEVAVIEISKETLEDISARHPQVKQVLERFYQERANATVELMVAKLRGRS